MKRVLFVAAIGLLVTGCSSDEVGVRLLNAHPWNDSCEIDAEHVQTSGSLDLSATSSYILAFEIANDLSTTETSVGGEVIQPSNQNNFFAETAHFSYVAEPEVALDDEVASLHYVSLAGSDSSASFVDIDLMQPQAFQTLVSNVGAGQDLSLLVTFHLEGRFASGKKGKTNDVSFPIRVRSSGFQGCPAGDRVAPTGPCGNAGQDSAIGCCTNPVFTAACG